jgi:hypothetical protein
LIFDKVTMTSIQFALFKIASDEKTNTNNRSKIYAIHKQYAAYTGVAFATDADTHSTDDSIHTTLADDDDDDDDDDVVTDERGNDKRTQKVKSYKKVTHNDEQKSVETVEKHNHSNKHKVDKKRKNDTNNSSSTSNNNNNNNRSSSSHSNVSNRGSATKNGDNNERKKHKLSPSDQPSTSSSTVLDHSMNPSSHQDDAKAPAAVTPELSRTPGAPPAAVPAEFIAATRCQHARPGYIFNKVLLPWSCSAI